MHVLPLLTLRWWPGMRGQNSTRGPSPISSLPEAPPSGTPEGELRFREEGGSSWGRRKKKQRGHGPGLSGAAGASVRKEARTGGYLGWGAAREEGEKSFQPSHRKDPFFSQQDCTL